MIYKVKNILKSWSYHNSFIDWLFKQGRAIVMFFIGIGGDEKYAKRFYKIYTKQDLNLENPQSFNEKLWWLKLHNRDPLITKCSDKNAVREYVIECGYPDILIPQLKVYNDEKEIDLSEFREEVILKCNHGSGENFLYKGDSNVNERKLKRKFRRALKTKSYKISREYNYKDIPPKIVVEKVIRDKNGNLPLDYRFFCFDGVPKLLMMDIGTLDKEGIHRHHYPRAIFDMDFKRLDIEFGRENYQGEIKKPENYERMIEIAAKLSEPFVHCRVDLYNVDGNIYFGECTFYHGGGCQRIRPPEWDFILGSWIDLKSDKIVLEKSRNE